MAALAAFASRIILVPLNWRWTPAETIRALNVAVQGQTGGERGTFALLCDENCKGTARVVAEGMKDKCSVLVSIKACGRRSKTLDLTCSSPGNDVRKRIDVTARQTKNLETSNGIMKKKKKKEEGEKVKDEEDVAAILFTSGTTSRKPKGALLTHKAFFLQAEAKKAIVGYSSKDAHIHCAPLHHVSGLCALVTALRSNAKHHVFVPKFSPRALVSAVRSFKVPEQPVCILAVPSMLKQIHSYLENSAGQERRSMDNVRLGLLGGDAVDGQVARMCSSMFPRASVFSTYGMTEACSSIAIAPVRPEASSSSSTQKLGGHYVGMVCPHLQVAVCDPSSRQIVSSAGSERVGELVIRGPSVCLGYVTEQQQQQQENQKKAPNLNLPHDWFRTGDLGWLDHKGGLYVCGRMNDAIRSGSEMIYPSDVERELHTCQAVKECIVFGLKDDMLGEKACALIVLNQSNSSSSSSGHLREWQGSPLGPGRDERQHDFHVMSRSKALYLKSYLGETRHLASYRTPRLFIVTSQPLPRNATGKVERNAIQSHMQTIVLQSSKVRSKL